MNGPAGPIIYPAYLDQKGAEFLFRFGRAKGAHNDIRDIVYAHPPWPATGPMGPMPHRGHAVRRDIFITLWPSDPFSQVSQKRRNLYYLSPIDHRARDRTPFLFFLPSNNRSKIRREETTRRGEGRGLEKLVKSYRVSVSPWRESATASLRPYRCHLEHGEGLASARGRKIGRGRGLKATKRVGGAVPWWPPVRYSFLRVTRADLYDP